MESNLTEKMEKIGSYADLEAMMEKLTTDNLSMKEYSDQLEQEVADLQSEMEINEQLDLQQKMELDD